ncbi:MerR family transcriptional regulator [Gemmiger formicilis]|nr:MerR family transcriptional regulator [Gemmiger formicilis]
MNIKQASDASGISSRNIRYYEQAGLLCPARDPQNDYRTYTEQDIRTLKLIRMLRMLGVPLEEIRPILQGEVPLYWAAEQQAQRLQQQAQELEAARRFCCQLQENQPYRDRLAGCRRLSGPHANNRCRRLVYRVAPGLSHHDQGRTPVQFHLYAGPACDHTGRIYRRALCLCQRAEPESGSHQGRYGSPFYY